ncbi:Uncharacterized protein Adt_23130 [Abeliophyllum distichum]|uniref:Uncharacterized protein n=1 Tax=Abeliophyllum distichum TaxID=126358 RepID=A0ABD1SAG7_9LAMI
MARGLSSGKELLTTTNVEKGSSRGRHLKDVPVDLPDDDPLDDETTFHDIRFPPTTLTGTLNWFEVAHWSLCVLVYPGGRFRLILALEFPCQAELRKEVDNLKKEIGEKDSQAKLAESRAKAQEDEIDTLRSTLARAQEDAVSSYKASSEFSSCMHMYGA